MTAMRSTSSFLESYSYKSGSCLDQHAHAAAEIVAQRSDLRKAPKELHLLVYTQDDAIRRGGLSKAMYRQMLRRSSSARRETKSSATPTLGALEGRSLLREHALYV